MYSLSAFQEQQRRLKDADRTRMKRANSMIRKYRGGEHDVKHEMELARRKRSEREGRKQAESINRKYRAAEQDIKYNRRRRRSRGQNEPSHMIDEDENANEKFVFKSVQAMVSNFDRRNDISAETQNNVDAENLSATAIDLTNTATEVDEYDEFLPSTPLNEKSSVRDDKRTSLRRSSLSIKSMRSILKRDSSNRNSMFSLKSFASFFSTKRLDEVDEMVSSAPPSSPNPSINRSVGYSTLNESISGSSDGSLEAGPTHIGHYDWSNVPSFSGSDSETDSMYSSEFARDGMQYTQFSNDNTIAYGYFDWSAIPSATESEAESHEKMEMDSEEEEIVFYDAPLSLRGVMFKSNILDLLSKKDSNTLSSDVIPESSVKKIVRFEEESDNRLFDITDPLHRHTDVLDIYNEILDCPLNDNNDPFQKKYTKAEFYREFYTDEMENTSLGECDYDSDLEDDIPRGLLYTMGGFIITFAVGGITKLVSALQKGEDTPQLLVEDAIHAAEVIADSSTSAAALSSTSTSAATSSAIATSTSVTTTSAAMSSTGTAAIVAQTAVVQSMAISAAGTASSGVAGASSAVAAVASASSATATASASVGTTATVAATVAAASVVGYASATVFATQKEIVDLCPNPFEEIVTMQITFPVDKLGVANAMEGIGEWEVVGQEIVIEYNDISGGCGGLYQREITECNFMRYEYSNVDGEDRIDTFWDSSLKCNGLCPILDPLFGMDSLDPVSSLLQGFDPLIQQREKVFIPNPPNGTDDSNNTFASESPTSVPIEDPIDFLLQSRIGAKVIKPTPRLKRPSDYSNLKFEADFVFLNGTIWNQTMIPEIERIALQATRVTLGQVVSARPLEEDQVNLKVSCSGERLECEPGRYICVHVDTTIEVIRSTSELSAEDALILATESSLSEEFQAELQKQWGNATASVSNVETAITRSPSTSPSAFPSLAPSALPSTSPSAVPSILPSFSPSGLPSKLPSSIPSDSPSSLPSLSPSSLPSYSPSESPSISSKPTTATPFPTGTLSAAPTPLASDIPSSLPSFLPSTIPSTIPTGIPTSLPSYSPSAAPSSLPSFLPTATPSAIPSDLPTSLPSFSPSNSPSISPKPTTSTLFPTGTLSAAPTPIASGSPTVTASAAPTPLASVSPTVTASGSPTATASAAPTPLASDSPTLTASGSPTVTASAAPTPLASDSPTVTASDSPTVTASSSPTVTASAEPTPLASDSPTVTVSAAPTSIPSDSPIFMSFSEFPIFSGSPIGTATETPTTACLEDDEFCGSILAGGGGSFFNCENCCNVNEYYPLPDGDGGTNYFCGFVLFTLAPTLTPIVL